MTRVLVVDDDPHLREVVRYALVRQGWEVIEARDGQEALELAVRERPDLLVLDVVMPEMDGLSVCRELRRSMNMPILFLSSRDEEFDRVLGLEIGGDDYLCKPFSTRELVARIRALLRRPALAEAVRTDGEMLRAGSLRIDVEAHRAWVGELALDLTVTELAILRLFVGRPGRVWTRDDLAERAYSGGPRHVSDRTLDSHIRNLRAALRVAGLDPIETVHGVGWRLSLP